MIDIPAVKYQRINRGVYMFYIPEQFCDAVEMEHQRIEKKRLEQSAFRFGKPVKPRSTGPKSANHHLHGHATQIGAYVGEAPRKIIDDAVQIALSMYEDFRTREDYLGRVVPVSESEPWTTGEAAAVIDALHLLASEIDLTLREGE